MSLVIGGVAVGSALATSAVGAVASYAVGSMLGGGGSSNPGGGNPVTTADPFASSRPQYAQQLNQMMAPGATFDASDPSYQFRLQQGAGALASSGAANGLLNSGNIATAITNYGQKAASQEYQAQFDRLSMLSGARTNNSGQAAQLQSQQNAGSMALGQQIAAPIGQAVGGLFNSAGGNTGSSGNIGNYGYSTSFNPEVGASDPFSLSGF